MDATHRLLEGILKGEKSVTVESPASPIPLVLTPATQATRANKRANEFLQESIKGRHIWYLRGWEDAANALRVGALVWPDKIWCFYTLQQDLEAPTDLNWVITAHDPIGK